MIQLSLFINNRIPYLPIVKSQMLGEALADHPLSEFPRLNVFIKAKTIISTSPAITSSLAGGSVVGVLLLIMWIIYIVENFEIDSSANNDPIISSILIFLFSVLFLISVLPGGNLVIKVIGVLLAAQRARRYDLLTMMPGGAATIHWALVMQCLSEDFIAVLLRRSIFYLIALPSLIVLIFGSIFGLLFILARMGGETLLLVPFIGVITFTFFWMYINYRQSLVMAALMTLLFPWVLLGSAWGMAILFVATQAGIFATTFTLANMTSGWGELILWFIVPLVMRELLIWGLWGLTQARFKEDLHYLRLDR
ncbi:MAG: hypothetical protein H7Y11_01160 [Armatimonadetes bacterium]|nr:hypothetical protein [Anaerolineae bacterium]